MAILCVLLCGAAQAPDLKIDRVSVRLAKGLVISASPRGVNYKWDLRKDQAHGGWLEATRKPLAGGVGVRVFFSDLWAGDAARRVKIAYRIKIKVRDAPTITDAKTGERVQASVGSDGYLILPLQKTVTYLSQSLSDEKRGQGLASLVPYRFALQPGDRVDFKFEEIRLRYAGATGV